MSKHNNVNPGQYKVAGRLKMGDATGQHEQEKQAVAASRQREQTQYKKHKELRLDDARPAEEEQEPAAEPAQEEAAGGTGDADTGRS